MIKICLDTNILISAFIFYGKPAKVFDLATEKKIIAIISPEILFELVQILQYKFKRDKNYIQRQIKVITDVCELVKPRKRIKILKHIPDNKILEAAIAGNVDFIVTGDKKHLLPLKEFRGIPIVSPKQFLEKYGR